MTLAHLVPFILGALAVVQVGLNRRIAGVVGLMPAVILNAAVLLAVAAAFWVYVRAARLDQGPWMAGSGSFAEFGYWWVLPGLCGLGLVAGLPWAVERIGALQTFVILVAGQMLFSLAWDYWVERLDISAQRIVGALLAIAGAALTTIRR